MTFWDELGQLPSWMTILALVLVSVCVLIGIPLARMTRRRHRRVQVPIASQGLGERVMMAAALIPTVLVWLAVLGVSFIGLTGFARDTMGWDHWTNMLVPISLDGISVSFGGWAFVAVKRRRHPGRAYKIVLAAAALSATLNFVHGRDKWSIWAGMYLAFLSIAAMVMFHEMLDQFTADVDQETPLRSRYPRFGQRWLYAPISTLQARWAWIVYPPDNTLIPTVRNALAHRKTVQAQTRQERHESRTRHALPSVTEAAALHERRRADTADTPPLVHSASENGRSQGIALSTLQPISATAAEPPEVGRDLASEELAMNQHAEQLWIDYANKGMELTGPQLLDQIFERYAVSRSRRWATNRRTNAIASWRQQRRTDTDNEQTT